jgi:DNA-binding transcriptional ArsR family regulator
MSVQAITWAIKQEIASSAQKLVLICLANYADAEGVCFPGQTRLAKDASMTDRSVRTHLKALEDTGLITRQERRRADMTRTSDEYELHINRKTFPVEGEPTGRFASDLPENKRQGHRKNFPGNEPVREPSENPSVRARGVDADQVDQIHAECSKAYPGIGWRRTDPLAQKRVIAELIRDGDDPAALVGACRSYAKENSDVPHKFDNFVRNGLWRNYAPAAPSDNRDGWKSRLAAWVRDGTWLRGWGPQPGNPACKAPADLIRQAQEQAA